MKMLDVQSIAKTYVTKSGSVPALADVSFDVQSNEFICVVGPSGAGKTTLLKILSGLLAPTSGQILLEGTPVTGPPEQMALVFQDYSRSLYPWMRVAENISFPLKSRVKDRSERDASVAEAIRSVGLEGFERSYPWQLSGGMQQRVAIARALAYRPDILLMDEPFASVDAQTRSGLEDLVLELRRRYNMTILFVTHDIDEAVYLADRVVILTNRPTRVHEILNVPFGPQRDQITTKEQPEFVHMRSHVYAAISSMAAPQAQAAAS